MKRSPKAYLNSEFIHSRNARELRILAEYLEPRSRFLQHGVHRAVIFYGSARLMEPSAAQAKLATAQTEPEREQAQKMVDMSRFYDEAVSLSEMLVKWTLDKHPPNDQYAICTGGGPGIMEAVNRGAANIDPSKSIGLNISLPFEQEPNDYISPDMNFEFHYFFMRKFWFMTLGEALVIFPGGFGTCDELFETLTLIQTRKKTNMPVVLYGQDFWRDLINWDAFVDYGLISAEDIDLMHFVETPDEAFNVIVEKLNDR